MSQKTHSSRVPIPPLLLFTSPTPPSAPSPAGGVGSPYSTVGAVLPSRLRTDPSHLLLVPPHRPLLPAPSHKSVSHTSSSRSAGACPCRALQIHLTAGRSTSPSSMRTTPLPPRGPPLELHHCRCRGQPWRTWLIRTRRREIRAVASARRRRSISSHCHRHARPEGAALELGLTAAAGDAQVAHELHPLFHELQHACHWI